MSSYQYEGLDGLEHEIYLPENLLGGPFSTTEPPIGGFFGFIGYLFYRLDAARVWNLSRTRVEIFHSDPNAYYCPFLLPLLCPPS